MSTAERALERFFSLGELGPERAAELVELAFRLERAGDPRALAGRIVGLLFMNPSLRTLASMQAATARLGGTSFVIQPGAGSWKLELRDGVPMDGDAAEHVREAIPVLAGYCDLLAVRSFASFTDLARDLEDRDMRTLAALTPVPFVNLESAADHPCQALGDWKTLDELGVPRGGKLVLSWANHPKPLPLAVPAAVAEMAALRGMELTVLRPPAYAFPEALAARVARAAAAGGGSFVETEDRAAAFAGAHVVYAKSWGSAERYGDLAAETARRAELGAWCVDEPWFASALPDAKLMHCLPVRRDVVVSARLLDGARSAVVRQAHNRLYAQMAVLHRLLATP